jgi:hypothetical protein
VVKRVKISLACLLAAALAACAALPPGPMVPVAPGPGKSFAAFQADDLACRNYAQYIVAPAVAAANQRGVGSAVLGTALGAGLGAAIGGGRGAAIGAASGALFGTAVGASGANWSQLSIQQQYDYSYASCMTAEGNQAPGMGPPPPGAPPPPPPGWVPPPPG